MSTLTTKQKIEQLRKLIQETHEHGLKLRRELINLDKAGKAKSVQAKAKRTLLRWLEVLNRRRRAELAQLEKPTPKPKPAPFTMLDTVEPSQLRGLIFAAWAGYVGGQWPTFNELDHLYPARKHLSVAINASEKARGLDVERGDATPGEAPSWFHNVADHNEGKPVFYGDEENLLAFEETLRDAGILRADYYVWKAHYTNSPHIEAGSDATQWTEHYQGRIIDASLCEPWFI